MKVKMVATWLAMQKNWCRIKCSKCYSLLFINFPKNHRVTLFHMNLNRTVNHFCVFHSRHRVVRKRNEKGIFIISNGNKLSKRLFKWNKIFYYCWNLSEKSSQVKETLPVTQNVVKEKYPKWNGTRRGDDSLSE